MLWNVYVKKKLYTFQLKWCTFCEDFFQIVLHIYSLSAQGNVIANLPQLKFRFFKGPWSTRRINWFPTPIHPYKESWWLQFVYDPHVSKWIFVIVESTTTKNVVYTFSKRQKLIKLTLLGGLISFLHHEFELQSLSTRTYIFIVNILVF